MADSRSVLISGGGIAGLTAALCLSRIGYRVSVFEQAKQFDPVGAGIQLSPNALRILDDLGIGKVLRLTATSPQAIKILGAFRGKTLAEIPLGAEAISQFGLPYLCINRSDLHSALAAACRNESDISLFMDSCVKDCVEHPNGVSALVQQGTRFETHRGALFVCADGMKSVLRHDAFNAAPATHTGFEAWRATLPVENVPSNFSMDFSHLVWARGSHAIFYPVHSGRYVNIVIITKTKGRNKATILNPDLALLRQKTRRWHKSFRELFGKTDKWSVWPILETNLAGPWSSGSMVMIGDAAHGMPPYAAQGAAMAIEDAKVLADCIAGTANETRIENALNSFYEERKRRIKKVARLAKSNREIYHMGFPFSMARNIGMILIPAKKLLSRQAWIYNWKA